MPQNSSDRCSTGPIDLSTPLPKSVPSNPTSNPSGYRRVGSKNPGPRRTEGRSAAPAPGQLLRKRNPNRPQFRMGRRDPVVEQDNEAEQGKDDEDDQVYADLNKTLDQGIDVDMTLDQQIKHIAYQLRKNDETGHLPKFYVFYLECIQILLTNENILSKGQISMLSKEQISKLQAYADFDQVMKLSDQELWAAVEQINTMIEQEIEKFGQKGEAAYLVDELTDNRENLDDNQILAMESRLKLLTEEYFLTDEQSTLLESLTSENLATMSQKDIESAIQRVNALTNEVQELSEQTTYLVDELTDNRENLNDNQILAMESRLKLWAEEDTLTDEQRTILESLTSENLATMSQEDIDSTVQRLNALTNEVQELSEVYEEPTETLLDEDKFGPVVSDEEQRLLDSLSDDNIKNLSDEDIINIAGKLDLIGEDGTLLDPARYPFSRAHFYRDVADAQFAVDQAAEHQETSESAQEEAEEDEQDEEDEDEEEEEEEDEDDDRDATEMENYINEVIDPSPIAREPLPYTPKEHDTEELRLDWPNTPLTGSGLTESIVQKVTWLAKRLPHGYWTPSQIAERYEGGYMVRFNSDEEKELVLKLAAESANARAAHLSEKSGETVEAEDMQFESLQERGDEKERLADRMARGVYEEPAKRGNRMLDSVMRQLDNNETYKSEDAEKFRGRVDRLIGMIGGRARGGAREKGAASDTSKGAKK